MPEIAVTTDQSQPTLRSLVTTNTNTCSNGSMPGKESEIIQILPDNASAEDSTSVEDTTSTNGSSSFDRSQITTRQLYMALVGCVLLYFISALETTILATVYIDISNQYNDMSNGIWIITSYMLSSTAVQPLYGKLSDILGRVETILVSVGIFTVGSILCAVSKSLGMLVASRAVQGAGGGGLLSIFGVASAVGPVLGGLLVEHSTWRLIFWLNLPVCIPAMAIIFFGIKIPKPQGTAREKLKRVDFLGSFVFMCGIIPLVLAFSWGGVGESWTSAKVLSCIVVGAVMCVVFLVIEWKVSAEPIIQVELYKIRNVAVSSFSHFFFGAVTYGPIMFVPVWELSVKHSSEVSAGLHLLPMMLPMVIAAALAGALMARTGKYRLIIAAGGLCTVVGTSLLVLMNENSGNGQRIGFIAIIGVGIGLCLQPMLIAAQVTVTGRDMAAVTTMLTFLRSLGGIFVLSILSSVMNRTLRTEAARLITLFPFNMYSILKTLDDQSLISKDKGIPEELKVALTHMFQNTMHKVYIGLIPFAGIFFLIVLLFQHVDLNTRRKKTIK
ncbi:hypothetical protein FBU59_001734 [Linderina macrospora]|uniref:Uncharacterized protein n=1 Tax=Linderina macrospora TaxID=4868 RepID=A0ACC1JDA7_9FUNG|nr:hypothetical protein FBU59_001734 [Linderina macrospora]